MDWEAWARRAEVALDVEKRGDWKGLFAPNASFSDPNTPHTTDVRKISRETREIFPDWTQEITSIRGGDDWAVFEWIGRATYAGELGKGARIEMHGCTIIEVDGDGLVTSWKDYLDRKEPENQIRKAVREQQR